MPSFSPSPSTWPGPHPQPRPRPRRLITLALVPTLALALAYIHHITSHTTPHQTTPLHTTPHQTHMHMHIHMHAGLEIELMNKFPMPNEYKNCKTKCAQKRFCFINKLRQNIAGRPSHACANDTPMKSVCKFPLAFVQVTMQQRSYRLEIITTDGTSCYEYERGQLKLQLRDGKFVLTVSGKEILLDDQVLTLTHAHTSTITTTHYPAPSLSP